MANPFSSSSSCSLLNLKQHFIVSFLFVTFTIITHVNGCFTSIFSFGDSFADTGNFLQISLSEHSELPQSAFPPYGRTFFHHPTGRFSDGRLVIDFIAEDFRLPFLPPYFGGENGRSNNFQKGVNLAVAGATALDDEILKERGITNPATNVTLGVELGFFRDVLSSLCSSSSDCRKLLSNSLIVMGEIGGNDYNFAFEEGKSNEETQELVPLVIDTIASAIHELIELGAVTFLVPGNLPFGCFPSCLTNFEGSDEEEYDPLTGCLTWLNQFSEYHNQLLQEELARIQEIHPHVNIVYADYYSAAIRFYLSPKQFGFRKETLTKACCGGGGPYNFNLSAICGYPLVTSCCDDPSSYVSWDGIHYTEAANRLLSRAILDGLHTNFPISNSLCQSFTVNNKLSNS
ncbi:hypothetical protein SCA6_018660 [Theobroma cacao]